MSLLIRMLGRCTSSGFIVYLATAVAMMQVTFVAGSSGQSASVAGCAESSCAVTLQPVATLTHKRGPEFLPNGAIPLMVDSQGNVLTTNSARSEVVVFSKTGELTSSIPDVGRVQGFLKLANGNVAAYDRTSRSILELSREQKVLSRTAFPTRPTGQLSDGHFVVAALLSDPQFVGEPIHVVNRTGGFVRSFGSSGKAYRAEEGFLHQRRVVLLRDGSLLATIPGRFVLERWDPATGKLTHEVRVQGAAYFDQTGTVIDTARRPGPFVEALMFDEASQVAWALVRTADANWKPPKTTAERPYDPNEHDQIFDWLLYGVDAKTGRVLAERRFSTALWPGGPSPVVAARDRSGTYVLSRPQISPKSTR